ncbi:MAG: hypothetical protein E7388_06625 [Ruminococcaceae bacterium]|nr:hypothetical protein [Oscillospiraceae bacterium]
MKIKTFIYVIAILTILLTLMAALPFQVNGEEVTSLAKITSGSKDLSLLTDENPVEEENPNGRYSYTATEFSPGEKITISHTEKLTGIYVIWQKIYGEWSLVSGEITQLCGKNGFLHEYVAIENPSTEITIILPEITSKICSIYVFTEGELPGWVQTWSPPCEKADLMLLSTHSDDEHLFFAGILPTYAAERKLKVQVVYMTNHWDTINRPHEQINGLWAVGVKNYPVVGPFPDDADTLSKGGEAVENTLKRSVEIFGEQKLLDFQVEMLERFKPQVIIAHDTEGEYHHGAHMANTWSLQKALEMSAWKVPKTYIHLWSENKITMNWDQPLSSFGNKTAYEVSKLGYACHDSQHWTWFTKWLKGDGINKASDITKYSPCNYGLYKTTVGYDTGKNDFMENITPYPDPTPEPLPTEEPTPPVTSEDNPRSPEEATGKKTFIAIFMLVVSFLIIVVAAIKLKFKG